MSDMTTGSAALAGNPASDPAAGATGGDAGQQNITQVGLPGTPDGATSSTAPTSTGTWIDSIEDSELKGYVSNKGWSDPAELAKGYQNLEKLLGSEKMPMPKGPEDAEGWNRVYDKLGRPESPDGYGIKAPDGGWDARSLRAALRGVRDRTRVVVEEAAPRRYHWLQRESQTIDQVSRVVPELVDPKESLQAEVSQILETYPGLKAQPDWLHLATLGAWGMREWRKRLESAGKPATPARPAPAPNAVPRAPKLAGAPKVAVAAPAEGAAELEVLRERAMRPGATAKDREAFIRAQL